MKKYSLNEINSDAQILEKLKNVDGSGSGLDADKLNGKHLTDVVAVPKVKSNLTYYGYPIAYKGLWDTTKVINEISRFDEWVVGDTYQDPNHEEYDSTKTIIQGVRALGTKVYGYVPIGVTTENRDLDTLKQNVDDWNTIGVDGIFLDEFGFDYDVSRDRQISIVDYVHSTGVPIIANAWSYYDFAIDSLDELDTYNPPDWARDQYIDGNPDDKPLSRWDTDGYMLEDYFSNNGGLIRNPWETYNRIDLINAVRKNKNYPIHALSLLPIFGDGDNNVNWSKMAPFTSLKEWGAWASVTAFLFSLDYLGTANYAIGAQGTDIFSITSYALPPTFKFAAIADISLNNDTGVGIFKLSNGESVEVHAKNDDFSFNSSDVAINGLNSAELLEKIKGVDGSGSGLDADKFNGLGSKEYSRRVGYTHSMGNTSHKWHKISTIIGSPFQGTGAEIRLSAHTDYNSTVDISFGIRWDNDGKFTESANYTYATVTKQVYGANKSWVDNPFTDVKIIRTANYTAELWVKNNAAYRQAYIWEMSRGLQGNITYIQDSPGQDEEPTGLQEIYGGYGAKWISPTLQNGWVNYNTDVYGEVSFSKDGDGVVHIRGLVKDGTISNDSSGYIFTLPAGYRPIRDLINTTRASDGNELSGRLDIGADGGVQAAAGGNVWFSVCCSFKAEQ